MTGEAQPVINKIRVSDARAELGLRQEDLAEQAGVSHVAVRKAEKGETIRRLTAHKILKALNAERQRQGKGSLGIDELNWNVVG